MRTKLLIVIVGVALVGAGLLVLLTRKPAPTEPLPELPVVEITPAVPQPEYARYNMQASLPQVEKLPVYRYSETKNQPTVWARALGFSGEPGEIEDALEGTLLLWSQEGQTLVINEGGSGLSYRVDLKADPSILAGSFLPTFEQAAAVVGRTLTELGATTDLLEYDPTKNKALKTAVSEVRETKLAEAELLEIHFIAKIDNYPLYLQSGPESDPVLAWVGRDGKLLRLEYHSVGTVGEKFADYPVKDEEGLLKDLEGGKGLVVSSNLEGGEEIVSTTITKVSLGYLLPKPEAIVMQPIFVMQGQARTAKNKTGQITIYLEAINRNFY